MDQFPLSPRWWTFIILDFHLLKKSDVSGQKFCLLYLAGVVRSSEMVHSICGCPVVREYGPQDHHQQRQTWYRT